MKKLTLIFILLISKVMFSSPSYANWTKVAIGNENASEFYVDFQRIRKYQGYVYFWLLTDYLKPDKFGDLSNKTYYESDCKQFRMKTVSASYYTQPMGEGIPSITGASKNQEWIYPVPKSVSEIVLKSVCSF